jgi:hypothetical protein
LTGIFLEQLMNPSEAERQARVADQFLVRQLCLTIEIIHSVITGKENIKR